ncbi:WD repeat protein [Taphrina deformans PYCC 5710]|uniref:WD repeat protein n=1 Tax=Taphrina deformans (strain PYCC 5710 / ATCC 11124 / CBS 356.35 / IMI 108563 / JCM 9778 / NBRC 8474) TaxID=1097556 RepID=R4X9F6_TAPDE|nr:WD repeat protein [Taphrina deformans PYCC 5710]|eukprot:CCG82376.1 WD repeat protein [Taphrina deformans PYCC 5710]
MEDQEAELQKFLGTTSFGARNAKQDLEAAYARTKRTEAAQIDASSPVETKLRNGSESDEDSLEDSSSDEDDTFLPISHEILLEKHTRAVSGLALDRSGSRIVSGSYDNLVAFWDFAGMNSSSRAFKILEPFESHQLRSVDFNSTSELLLLTAANWQPKIVSREGEEIGEMPRGDPYLRDMKNTKGHVGEVTSGAWHPTNAVQCVTSASDATIRIWDASNVSKCLQVLVHKPKKAGAGKVKCTVSKFSPDGKIIGSAFVDGTLSLWATDGPHHRPMAGSVIDAHQSGTETTDITFSLNGYAFASRGSNCVKLWDRRNFKVPTAILDDLPNRYEQTSLVYSPNNQELLTATSTGSQASIQVLAARDLRPIQKISCTSPAIRVIYHSQLNQIITSHADGKIHVLYSPDKSVRGAKLVVSKAPKSRHIDDLVTADIDEAAGEVRPDEAAQLAQSSSRAQNAARKDPRLSNMPELPGTARYAERKVIGDLTNFRDQDPQKELLKYDAAAKKDPRFFGIYEQNQPETKFAEIEESAQGEADSPANKRFKFTPRDKK